MEEPIQQPDAAIAKRDPAALISMIANLAVLLGLVFVTIQIRQNTTALRGAAYQTWLATNVSLNMAITSGDLGKTIATGHADARNLSEGTAVAYSMWIMSFMQMAQATDYLYRQQGAIDKSLWAVEIQRAAWHLSVPAVRQWWDAGAKTQLAPEFVKLVESTTVTMGAWGWDKTVGFKPLTATR